MLSSGVTGFCFLFLLSDSILGEIKALVARNSDSLTVSASPALVHLLFVSLVRFLYAVSYPPLQMDTLRASNKGYSAEMFVVTFNHAKETVEDGSKIKIMLVSSQQIFFRYFLSQP
jgi:hypothetical protein